MGSCGRRGRRPFQPAAVRDRGGQVTTRDELHDEVHVVVVRVVDDLERWRRPLWRRPLWRRQLWRR